MTLEVETLLLLLRAGLYDETIAFENPLSVTDWNQTFDLASRQGVVAVAGEGLSSIPQAYMPPKAILLEWLGLTFQQKQSFAIQRKQADELIEIWRNAGISCIELKGYSIGQLYHVPETRYSCDFDCLLSDYEKGNEVVEQHGIKVNRDFYKNSSFHWNGLYVENHQFCTPVRGNREMKRLERKLRELLADGSDEALANFNALFLMEHCWAHFFENALSLKHLCDWAVLRKKKGGLIDWKVYEQYTHDVGLWTFSESMNRLADLLDGIIDCESLSAKDKFLLDDMTTSHEVSMNDGWKTRLQLFRNYFTQSWKYRLFSNHSAMYCLVRTVNGFVFDRNPKV